MYSEERLFHQLKRISGQILNGLGARTTELEAELALVYEPAMILSQVFVLESESDILQGTCFNLAGVGLVTCAHVLGQDLRIRHPSDVGESLPAAVISRNPVVDIARLSAPELQLSEGLPLGSADDLETMDRVLLAGYPNYRLGDSGIVTVGTVAGFRMVSGIRRLLVDTPIVAGNSGGPVLNRKGQVIGIAVTGADRMESAEETENHGVIPIDALALL